MIDPHDPTFHNMSSSTPGSKEEASMSNYDDPLSVFWQGQATPRIDFVCFVVFFVLVSVI